MAAKLQAFPYMKNREGLSAGQVAMQWGKTHIARLRPDRHRDVRRS